MSQCPDRSQLWAFGLGRLSDADFDRIAAHVEECEVCESELDKVDSDSDDLADSLKGLATLDCADPLVAPDVVNRVANSVVALLGNDSSSSLSLDAGRHYSRLLKEGTCQLGRFELLEEIGLGSFGHVFRAKDTELDRTVAVKIQRAGGFATEEEAKRFLQEARSAAPLVHPSIVSLYDTGRTDDGVCYLVTEFVDGETLDNRLHRGRLDFRTSAKLVSEIGEALHHAHQHGVVHRDIKPSNILIDADGNPHVTDFGLAKLESAETTMTSDGRIMGTPAYMSPEHARGAAHEADARTDVYSLGVILYELITGHRPFHGAKQLLLLQVLEDEPRKPRQLDDSIPRDLETICLKAMSKSPSRRYQSVLEFAKDLRRFLAGDPIQARPNGYAERLIRWCRKYPFAAALFVGVTVGSLVGFGYLRHLQTWFVQEMALEHARQYSDMLEEFTATYSDVRGQFFTHGDDAVGPPPPLPATLQIEVAKRISRDEDGMQVRVFSPFSFRAELRPKDDFEYQSLNALSRLLVNNEGSNDQPLEHYRFVTTGNRPYLKYARGQVMKDSCVDCHNTHKDTPKTDWKPGDLAGVLTITRPLDRDVARARTGFRGASLLMVSIVSVLTACGLGFAYKTRAAKRG